MFIFSDVFKDVPEIHIVDVGASPIDGEPVYQPVLTQGNYKLTCFEPNPAMFEKLTERINPK